MPLARDYDYMTYKQFLEYQSLTDQKTEYSNGDIFYMSPTHPNHNKVQNELYFQLRSILNNCNKCDVYKKLNIVMEIYFICHQLTQIIIKYRMNYTFN